MITLFLSQFNVIWNGSFFKLKRITKSDDVRLFEFQRIFKKKFNSLTRRIWLVEHNLRSLINQSNTVLYDTGTKASHNGVLSSSLSTSQTYQCLNGLRGLRPRFGARLVGSIGVPNRSGFFNVCVCVCV